jgi:hypothetical protein
MKNNVHNWLCRALMVALCGMVLPGFAPKANAMVKKMSLKGYLYYRSGASSGKNFRWNLRFYESTGLVIGTGNDRDGYAQFFGTYNKYTKRFKMVKHFAKRRRGKKKFYYKGRIRPGGRLSGTAHFRSFWGKRYAYFSAKIRWSRWKYSVGRKKSMAMKGKLRYYKSGSKSFYWRMTYYPRSGRCFGTVSDRDGKATFDGVYDKPTKRFYMRKKYSRKRAFYYIGRLYGTTIRGTARKYSFTSRKTYGSWTARLLWSESKARTRRFRRPARSSYQRSKCRRLSRRVKRWRSIRSRYIRRWNRCKRRRGRYNRRCRSLRKSVNRWYRNVRRARRDYSSWGCRFGWRRWKNPW